MTARLVTALGALLVAGAIGYMVWANGRGAGPIDPKGPARRANVLRGRPVPFDNLNHDQGVLEHGSVAGRDAVHATYDGSGVNGYARGVFNVNWHEGEDVAYGASFYLPSALFDNLEGGVALMRWDDFPAHPNDASHGGIVIFHTDRRARLISERLAPSGKQVGEEELSPPIALPHDRWFRIEVRQRLGSGGDARNEVYLDGTRVGASSARNIAPGRFVQRIRYGVVAIASDAQHKPLQLWFDDTFAAPGG